MTLTHDLRARTLANIRLTSSLRNSDGSYGVAFTTKDATDDTPTVAESRTKPADDFAAAVLLLWTRLHDGTIDADEYDAQVEAAFDEAIGQVPPDAQARIDALRKKALERAATFRQSAILAALDEDFPSEKQQKAWANSVAGAAWAAMLAVEAYESHNATVTWHCLDDDASCDECLELDGQTWALDDVDQWPGDGSTQCLGNCRCELS